ncbi:unnamed protein product [Spirodela intermedia]|uniref:Uncharacterized protein n=2 Tax=Spirodela intermedia TaxID=51605 RepID=A0A7I8LB48_SPIIN|nr:unnamed protein product [Spirodela intermedia]CAA6670214.1 unnamed protein product [Spirodela intermedia]CAA7407267.1 unnamed protein product [Spirodela intermedia]
MAIWKPAWLDALEKQSFFVSCPAHAAAKKNEKNVCCLDCCTSLCPHCLPSHRFHRLVQVRRYVYHEVVRLEDLEKLIDCSNVQPYTINSSKVVFIKKRPQSRQFKGSGNFCSSCDRCLQEPYLHCSLGCKVDFVLRQNKDLSPYLRTCDSLQLCPDDDTNHSTVVDTDEPTATSDSDNLSYSPPCAAESFRRKRTTFYACARSAGGGAASDAAASGNRRKSTPHRSPLC